MLNKDNEKYDTLNIIKNEQLERMLESSKKITDMVIKANVVSNAFEDFTNKINQAIIPIVESYDSNKILQSIIETTNVLKKTMSAFYANENIQRCLEFSLSLQKICNSFNVADELRRGSEVLLDNDFYPYENFDIDIIIDNDFIINDECKTKILKQIENDFEDYKDIIYAIIPEEKEFINQILNMYNNCDYRMCVLALLNLISLLANKNFNNKDFSQVKFINKEIEKYEDRPINFNKEYKVLIPYCRIEEKNNSKEIEVVKTNIINNNNGDVEYYTKYPYNRNSIIHGYNNVYGTKETCLRYFSVLMNIVDVIKYIRLIERSRNEA